MIPLGHIFRELFAERTRVLLTILAIAWGTASITTMLAVGEGLRQMFGRSMRGFGENILVVSPGQTSKAHNGLPEGHPVRLEREDVESMRASIPQLGAISGEHMHWAPMRREQHFRTGRLMGVDPDYGSMRNIIVEKGGRFIDELDMRYQRRVAVIGPEVVKELFPAGEDPVGQHIEIDDRPFLIVGIMRKKYQSTTFGGPDRDGTWIPGTTFEPMFDRRYFSYLIARPRTLAEMPLLKERMRSAAAHRSGTDPQDEEILRYWDMLEMQQITSNIFTGLQVLFGIVGGLTLIVAGVGIANVMYVSVSNATRDIGIRMATGARTHQVLGQYVLEGLLATALGGVLGMGASALLVWGVSQIPMQGDFFDIVGKPLPVLSAQVAAIVIAVLGAIGLAAGYFPARRAAQIDPAVALRQE